MGTRGSRFCCEESHSVCCLCARKDHSGQCVSLYNTSVVLGWTCTQTHLPTHKYSYKLKCVNPPKSLIILHERLLKSCSMWTSIIISFWKKLLNIQNIWTKTTEQKIRNFRKYQNAFQKDFKIILNRMSKQNNPYFRSVKWFSVALKCWCVAWLENTCEVLGEEWATLLLCEANQKKQKCCTNLRCNIEHSHGQLWPW